MTAPFSLQRQMGCSRAEFMAWLPGATRQAPLHVDGDTVTVMTGSGRVEITLEERPARRIARIALPVLDVSFRFHGLDAATREAFLAHFDLYTRRGGG